jgi:hypothetical protein
MGSLVTSDGSVTLPGLLLLIGTGLIAIGHHRSSADFFTALLSNELRPLQSSIGLGCIVLGLVLAVVAEALGVADEEIDEDAERRLLTVKYAMMVPRDVLEELRKIQSAVEEEEEEEKAEAATGALTKSMKSAVGCLHALARRCGKEQKQRQIKQQAGSGDDPLGIAAAEASSADRFLHRPHELESICQEAAYMVLRIFPSNDVTVSAAISLLAVVAGDVEVRRRNIEEADKFGLDEPINALKGGLTRSKQAVDPAEDDERISAELQRKGCLLLGALSDGDKAISAQIVDEDGLICVTDALDWYRYHEEVCNWGLWAIFALCYDHKGNKAELIKLDGIRKICRVMKDVPDSLEVARHGTAILFDMLREMPESVTNVSEIRRIAVGAGMHDVVKNAMDRFPQSKEIMMMGQSMLVATGYQGDIPHFDVSNFTS